jgi:S1-C subfamily serine protease
MRKIVTSPFFAALVGGAIVAAAMLIAGVGNTTVRTIIQPTAVGTTSATSGEPAWGRIYARDAPGVVYITATVVAQSYSPFDLFPSTTRGTDTGSGFVINRSGVILTNNHVIAGAVKITVAFADNQTVTAKVVGKDPDDDLALLKVNPDGLHLVPLALGNSDTVAVGDPTAAIGNPFGLPRSLTTGVVSALQREIQAPNSFEIDNVIQTDAPINPGNSGGPLLNEQGQVIGINSQIETERTGKVIQGFLGITTSTVDPALAPLHLAVNYGALIQTVQSPSPAARAGLRAGNLLVTLADGVTQVYSGGDVIVSLDGHKITGASALENAIVADRPGQVVELGIVRGSKHLTLAVKLGTRPDALPSAG